MPFFTNKFSPKKIPIRKCEATVLSRQLGQDVANRELALDIPPIRLSLSKLDLTFEDGRWIPESKGYANSRDKIKKKQKTLEEESNVWRLKFEILLDMLTETTIESRTRN